MPEDEGNPNIQVEVTDVRELHCFRLLLNPKSAPAGEVSSCCGVPILRTPDGFFCTMCAQKCEVTVVGSGRIEVMLHARSLVDLVHKCSTALCSWQKQTTDYLLEKVVMEAAATSLENPYRNDLFSERKCDRCGEPYRGPSVYCSLECAMADA